MPSINIRCWSFSRRRPLVLRIGLRRVVWIGDEPGRLSGRGRPKEREGCPLRLDRRCDYWRDCRPARCVAGLFTLTTIDRIAVHASLKTTASSALRSIDPGNKQNFRSLTDFGSHGVSKYVSAFLPPHGPPRPALHSARDVHAHSGRSHGGSAPSDVPA